MTSTSNVRTLRASSLEALESRIAPASLSLLHTVTHALAGSAAVHTTAEAVTADAGTGNPGTTDVRVDLLEKSSVAEDGSDSLVFTFTRSNNTAGDFSMDYYTTGTAFYTNDYATIAGPDVSVYTSLGKLTGTVTFHDGETTKTLTLDPTPDNSAEPNETAGITISGSIYSYTSSNPSATGTIVNDDMADLHLSVAEDHTVVAHGQTLGYTYSYANLGSADATNVVITATVPNGTTAELGSLWVPISPTTFQYTIGSLAAGETAKTDVLRVDVDQTVIPGLKTIDSTATIAGYGGDDTDPNLADNTATSSARLYNGLAAVSNSTGGGTVGIGSLPIVRVFDVATGLEAAKILAYEKTYNGGVRLAIGDMNGDGFDDIVTSTRDGSGRIRIFDGVTHARIGLGKDDIMQFNPFAANGAYVALSDINHDGQLDIIAGSGLGGGTVKVYNGKTGKVMRTETPFGADYHGGVRVAGGDVTGDGVGDIIAGQSSYGSKVAVLSGTELSRSAIPTKIVFSAGSANLRDGVFVSAADTTGDGVAEVIVGRGKAGSTSDASVGIFHLGVRPGFSFSPVLPVFTEIKTIGLSNSTYMYGARVAATDVNFDGIADIVVGSGPLGKSAVQVLDGRTGTELNHFDAFAGTPLLGVFAAAGAPRTTGIIAPV